MKIYIGFDKRQPVAFHVLAHSIIKRASIPVSITALNIDALPLKRTGLTEFTYSRYLIPLLEHYGEKERHSLFLDADMLCLGDIAELKRYESEHFDVMVVKNQQRFEWPSLMLFNNAKCKALTLDYIAAGSPNKLEWAQAGELPPEWNHCIGYDDPRPDAKLVHFTQGIPIFQQTKNCEYADQWSAEAKECFSSCSWDEIMGSSVHAERMRRELRA